MLFYDKVSNRRICSRNILSSSMRCTEAICALVRHTASGILYFNEANQNCGSKTCNVSSWLFLVLVVCCLWGQSGGMRPLRENGPGIENTSWLDQNIFSVRSGLSIEQYSMSNISGTYKGTWIMHNTRNNSSKLPELHMTYGNILIELLSSPTEIHGVHYVQGLVVLGDGQSSNDDIERMQIRMDGVFVWPLRQLRMVVISSLDGKASQSEEFLPSNPYHLLGIFSLQVLQESPREHSQRSGKNAPILEMSKICRIQMAAQFTHLTNGEQARQQYELKGLVESPMIEGEGECFSAITVNATSVNVDVYYNKAVNYTLMVTFTSFIQVLFLIRQMDHSSTQSGAAKISLWMIGQQAIIDAYLCLLHLTAGILVESLFNAFATAAFFKFVIFSIFEMRYLLAIWKARRPTTSGEGWETMRRELSVLYSRFYGFLLGGILIMYELHNLLHYILFLLYSFWIPQIVSNVRRDSRKPVHVHYIIGITATRLAIPLYAFGCPKNFFRLKTDIVWCISLVAFLVVQAIFLLLQHYFGSRWFIPRQLLPEKYCYFRRVDRATLQGLLDDSNFATDCVICMAGVDIELHATDCMVTPCDHFFHAGCLQRWMDIKMECPTCRRPLPPI